MLQLWANSMISSSDQVLFSSFMFAAILELLQYCVWVPGTPPTLVYCNVFQHHELLHELHLYPIYIYAHIYIKKYKSLILSSRTPTYQIVRQYVQYI
jgi:hypothetical protein